jgi:hypothetical protein
MINYYIGLRGWQYLGSYIPMLTRSTYWGLFWSVALSYLVARVLGGYLPEYIRYYLTLIGAYWLAAMFYLLQFFIILDLIRLVDRYLHFLPLDLKTSSSMNFIVGIIGCGLVLLLLTYGTWNAHNPKITHYDIEISKQAGSLGQLHVVMISDIHLGEIMHNGRLIKLVEAVETLQPDILLLPGDVIDEDVGTFIKQEMAATFQKLNPKYGMYAVPGNHEYIGGQIETVVRYLEQAGIRVLRDEYVKIADSFYIVGLDDKSRVYYESKEEPRGLKQVLEGVNVNLPLLLLNHQPNQFDEAVANGIDLQLSGHSHKGQLFPINYITKAMFEVDYGLMHKGTLHAIVSSGFGTWGPPIRLGNRPEIVDIVINFLP